MICDQFRQQALRAVPFAQNVGIAPISMSRGASEARLIQRREVSNHVDALHRWAPFSLGETASGPALVGALSPVIVSGCSVAGNASNRYLRSARGTITATGRIADDLELLTSQLKLKSTIQCAVFVKMLDEAMVTVAEMPVESHVRMKV